MQYPFSIYFLNFFVQKVRKRALNHFVFVKKTTLCGRARRQPSAVFMQVQKNRLTNYSNEYKLRSKVIQMHNNFTQERGNADAAMRGVFCAAAVVGRGVSVAVRARRADGVCRLLRHARGRPVAAGAGRAAECTRDVRGAYRRLLPKRLSSGGAREGLASLPLEGKAAHGPTVPAGRRHKKYRPSKRTIGIFGGGRWIRTIEGIASRFTVCPLWPLGNSPICNLSEGGAGRRTRTPDLLITNQLLYQLSYTSTTPAYVS